MYIINFGLNFAIKDCYAYMHHAHASILLLILDRRLASNASLPEPAVYTCMVASYFSWRSDTSEVGCPKCFACAKWFWWPHPFWNTQIVTLWAHFILTTLGIVALYHAFMYTMAPAGYPFGFQKCAIFHISHNRLYSSSRDHCIACFDSYNYMFKKR